MENGKIAIGIDLGGTKAIIALVDESGEVRLSRRVEVREKPAPEEITAMLSGEMKSILSEAGMTAEQVAGFGVGAAGEIMSDSGILTYSPNFDWHDVPLVDMLQKSTGLKAVLANDVNAGAYGEWLFGAGRGTRNLVAIFLGTGIGGGFVFDGKLYSGSAGFAAEIGHIIFRPDGEMCGCGRRGHFEAYAGGAGIAARFQAAVESGRMTSVLTRVGGNPKNVKATDIYSAALEGDTLCSELWGDADAALNTLALNLAVALDPDVIVFGGGIVDNAPDIIKPIADFVKQNSLDGVASHIRIVRAELGENAVAIGAAALGGGFGAEKTES
jgi:glucokinase